MNKKLISNPDFMEGKCCEYAVALHRVLGYSLVLLTGERPDEDDDETTVNVVIHALGVDKHGIAWDVEGKKGTPSDVLDYYEELNQYPPYDYTDTNEYSDEKDFWEAASIGDVKKDEAALKIAIKQVTNKYKKIKSAYTKGNEVKLIKALKEITAAKKKEPPYAVVDRVPDNNWKRIFRWADSENRTFQGRFETEEEVIRAIPLKFKKIVVQYRDDKGNEVNKTINR
jgi:hypothetical protein